MLQSPTAFAARSPARPGLTLLLLAFAHLIISLDYTIVFVALPEIGRGLGFSAQTQQWVISAYVVPYGGLLLLGGRASDRLGRRRMFILGLFLYALASLMGGLATVPAVLIAARALQGVGGAFLFPATLSLVNTTFAEGADRNRALSTWGGAGAGGLVLGSLLGGVLTETFGWKAVFYVNVPLAGIGILLAFTLIAADEALTKGRRFDFPGALTATTGTTLFVFALVQGPESGWTSMAVLGSGTVAVLLLVAFVIIEARSRDPLMALRLFANRNSSTGVIVTFLFTATFSSLAYFLTVFLQNVHGNSALQAGLAFIVPCAVIFVGSTVGGPMATRLGIRTTLISGLLLGVAGTLLLGRAMSPNGSYMALVPGLVILSLGQGIVFTTMFAAAATGVSEEDQGIASGIASTGQQIGTAMGLAVLVPIANAGTAHLSGEALRVASADRLRTVVYVIAAGIAAMIVVALNFRTAVERG
ncbi:MFS transporter [Pendulispora albinea]|uniref:MFS transporter n=1 Tax=Pendulispora albinea TaxID=2741071 RepID=A0ABZ2LRX6_9BACT